MKNLEAVVISGYQVRHRQYRDAVNIDKMKSGEKYMYHYGYLPIDRDAGYSSGRKEGADTLHRIAEHLMSRSKIGEGVLYQNAVNGYEFEYWFRKI